MYKQQSISKIKTVIAVTLLSFISQFSFAQAQKQPVDYVDNFIGVRDTYSSCVLGPQLPHASINPSPHTPGGGGDMDGYSMGQPIRGFAQLHVSGTGWGKYGQIFISPQVGLAVEETAHDSEKSDEIARPYEYSVKLNRYNIKTDVTPSLHSAIYRFTFPQTKSASILMDVSHNISDIAKILNGKFVNGSVAFTSKNGDEIKGYGEYTGGFADTRPYRVYFCARVNKVPAVKGTYLNGTVKPGSLSEQFKAPGDRIGSYFQFKTKDGEEVLLKVGVSLHSIEQAAAWLDAEIPKWDYNKVKDEAIAAWNKELGKIQISGSSEKEKTIFYSALYHASLMPRNRTNDMEGFGKNIPVWDDHLAVWDTWRTLYPLKVLTNPEMVSGTINSFMERLKSNKMVKDAYVAGIDMHAEQGGNNIDNIVSDAFVKGVKGVDWKEAYKLMKHHADYERNGINSGRADSGKMYKALGWIPAGKMSNSITLEYAYNDYCAALMAKNLGSTADYEKYLSRSKQWVNLWNPEAESDGYKGFNVPKKLNGDFVNINPKKSWGSWKEYFYEGSSWTYSYFVPHQFDKLVELSGGKQQFAKKLQHGFENNLIDYGNEPAFLVVHAFHYADRSDLASFYTRKLMNRRFSLQGYGGNDDSGAMSSWYIFSSLGFFPNAGQDIYYLTGSLFPSATLNLGEGRELKITANNASQKNLYIQSVKINGKPWKKFWFTHQDIANGGTIEFEMGDTPKAKIE